MTATERQWWEHVHAVVAAEIGLRERGGSSPPSSRTPHPLFRADGLEGRYATSPVAVRLAKRIREEATGRRGRDIELEDMEKYELLRFLDQVAFDRMLETELLELQAMLRGERGPGEPSTPPAGQG